MAELSLNLPVVGEKDTTAEPKVTTALTEIQTQFNGKIAAINLEAGAVTGEKTKADLSGLRLVQRASAFIGQTEAAGVYFFRTGSNAAKKAAALAVKYTLDEPEFVFYNPADFAIVGKTTKMVLKADMITNSTPPTGNFTFALYQLEGAGGVENELELKYKAPIAASEVEIKAPSGTATGKTVAFAFPAEGFYSVGLKTSAETASKSLTALTMSVFAKNE